MNGADTATVTVVIPDYRRLREHLGRCRTVVDNTRIVIYRLDDG